MKVIFMGTPDFSVGTLGGFDSRRDTMWFLL